MYVCIYIYIYICICIYIYIYTYLSTYTKAALEPLVAASRALLRAVCSPGANSYTPEIAKAKIHRRMQLKIHWAIPVNIHWTSGNPLENTTDK